APPRPGAWPTTGGAASTPAPPQEPAAVRTPPPAPATPAPGPASTPVGDPSRVRQMWPEILEAVKRRRRLTWMLLFNNAQVAGFDGETLQIGFDNPGARNSFANSGSEDVLKQAISDALGVQWRIEAIVDPSGGSGQGGSGGPGNPGGPGHSGGFGSGYGGGGGSSRPPAPGPQQPPTAPASYNQSSYNQAAQNPASYSQQPGPGGPAAHERAAAPGPRAELRSAAQTAPPPVDDLPPIEDDIPEDDDPDLVDSALSGHDLFIRELGATVIEEIRHD
ncbi:MAG TPA: DNA polymerase III subunit gamma and tau, partial [Streptomyces sp.]